MLPLHAISLFSSSGVGELGLKRSGIEVLAANEILADRCALYASNHPRTTMFQGDIWKVGPDIVRHVRQVAGPDLFLAYATPPCQGMSTNGYGKLKAEVAAGNRPAEDARNRLIIPAMDVIAALRPHWVLLENVPGMRDTSIRTEHGHANILEYVAGRLGPDYAGGAEVLSCSHYGIAQLRRRLIAIFTREPRAKEYYAACGGTFFPSTERTTPPTLRSAIGHCPPLDAVRGKEAAPDFHPMHRVGVMKPDKYWWVSCTPEGETAYNNQCANSDCRFDGNERHVDSIEDGTWRSSKSTPIVCAKCGSLLPRPTFIDAKTGLRRLIRGFHSAYRRMEWDKPARTLTRNYPFEASDNKVHPSQNRVLSTYEALVLQTIADYDYHWFVDGKPANQSLIARTIGESVPPRLIEFIARKIVGITRGVLRPSARALLF